MLLLVPCGVTLMLPVGMQFFYNYSIGKVMHGFIIVSCEQANLLRKVLSFCGAYIESYSTLHGR